MYNNSALIAINLQNDYFYGGVMEVPNAVSLIPKLNKIKDKFSICIFVKDRHSINHKSFRHCGGKYNPHCIKETFGEKLNNDIEINDNDQIIHINKITMHPSNSAFYNTKTSTVKKLSRLSTIVCGLYFSKSVYSTIIDAHSMDYEIYVIKDMCLDIDDCTININYLKNDLGIKITSSQNIFSGEIDKNLSSSDDGSNSPSDNESSDSIYDDEPSDSIYDNESSDESENINTNNESIIISDEEIDFNFILDTKD
jgi:nicotinamidase/pyrazinamidase